MARYPRAQGLEELAEVLQHSVFLVVIVDEGDTTLLTLRRCYTYPGVAGVLAALQRTALLDQLPLIFRTVAAKQKSKQLGFITLFNDDNGTFWLKTSRGFHTALYENLASLQQLIDSAGTGLDEAQTVAVNRLYSKIAKLI